MGRLDGSMGSSSLRGSVPRVPALARTSDYAPRSVTLTFDLFLPFFLLSRSVVHEST